MSALGDCFSSRRSVAASMPGGFREGEGAYLAYEDWFLRKFRHWRGRSGRSYAFSIYAPEDCPAYEHAVLIVTAPAPAAFSPAWISAPRRGEARRTARPIQPAARPTRVLINVLAEGLAERRALIEDLG